jgi:hypothetical protein
MSHPHLGGKAGTGPYQYGKTHAGNSGGRAPGQVTQNAWVTDDAMDMSVNMARTNYNWAGELTFVADKKNTSQVSGNFNGGGTGNKPIRGIPGYEGVAISNFPVIDLEAELRTADDSDEQKLGISFNAIVDLEGSGTGPFVIMVVTNTLNSRIDKYGESGASASLTDFDISNYNDGGTLATMDNVFYIVGNLPGSGTGNASPGGNPSWTSNPVNLDVFINGGAMPITGLVNSDPYPNAVICDAFGDDCISTDGGHPVGIKLTGITVQTGGSGNSKRSVTAITQMAFDGTELVASS